MKKIIIIAMMTCMFTGLYAGKSELTNDYRITFSVAFDNDLQSKQIVPLGYVNVERREDHYRMELRGGRLAIPKKATTITVVRDDTGETCVQDTPIDWTKSARIVMDLDHNWGVEPIL